MSVGLLVFDQKMWNLKETNDTVGSVASTRVLTLEGYGFGPQGPML
jgi:hypothetical protein